MGRLTRCGSVALLCSLVPLAAAAGGGWQPGHRGDLAFEASAFLRDTAYSKPDKTADDFDANGAYGPMNRAWNATHQGRWLIEEQRYGFDAIVAGVSTHRQDLVARGETILDWGFGREKPDGSFDCADRFHSMSFFVEAVAHAALLLEGSDLAAENRAWIDGVKPLLRRSVLWMMAPANAGPGQAKDAPYGHRFYLDADAIGETGVLLHDKGMIEASRAYVRAGLARQDVTGSNPEKGGSDTSYHAVGLLFAEHYYTLVADDATRAALRPMLARGLAWLAARVRPDGTVDQTGNTRTGFGQERGPQGNLKTMSYGSAYRASFYWSLITGDERWAELARRLHSGQAIEKEQRKRG